MPALIRFMLVNFAAGAMIGLAVLAALFLAGAGPLHPVGSDDDRFLAMVMLGFMLPSSFGLGFLGTALCVSPED